jgi:membrane protease YdiL (CAAX protease family)
VGRPLLLISLFIPALLAAEPPVAPQRALLWSLFVPGGGHFKMGELGTGLGYVGVEISLGVWSYNQQNRLAKGEINLPLVYLQQVHVTGMYTAYRSARLKGYDRFYKNPVDPTPAPQLIAAPFRWSVIKSPWVWGAALAGAGINWAGASLEKNRRSYRALGTMRLQGHHYERRGAVSAYHAYWVPVSLGAGVSEEMLFRGVIQADWEEAKGPRTAVLTSSVLFGLAHLNNFKGGTISNALFATAAGYHLGRRAQANRYRLSENIAAHTWFDIAAGAAIFFADPEHNPIGAEVSFRY